VVEKLDLREAFLSESPLFDGLGKAEINDLVERAEIHEFGSGEVVVEEGTLGDAIFLLYDGRLSVRTRDGEGRNVELATLGRRGAFFGEIALADPGPRSATVLADEGAVLLKLSLDALNGFFAQFSDAQVVVLRNIARVLAQRLRDANALVSTISSA
jgi:CRP/FNR family cyclic AMP-dependent transcriptional regulator